MCTTLWGTSKNLKRGSRQETLKQLTFPTLPAKRGHFWKPAERIRPDFELFGIPPLPSPPKNKNQNENDLASSALMVAGLVSPGASGAMGVWGTPKMVSLVGRPKRNKAQRQEGKKGIHCKTRMSKVSKLGRNATNEKDNRCQSGKTREHTMKTRTTLRASCVSTAHKGEYSRLAGAWGAGSAGSGSTGLACGNQGFTEPLISATLLGCK